MSNFERPVLLLPARPPAVRVQSVAYAIARALEADERAIKVVEGFHGYCDVAVTSRGEEIVREIIAKLLLEGKGTA